MFRVPSLGCANDLTARLPGRSHVWSSLAVAANGDARVAVRLNLPAGYLASSVEFEKMEKAGFTRRAAML